MTSFNSVSCSKLIALHEQMTQILVQGKKVSTSCYQLLATHVDDDEYDFQSNNSLSSFSSDSSLDYLCGEDWF